MPSFADRIDPDEDAVYAQQLLAHTVGDLVGVDRSLDVEADVAQRLRDVAQPRLLELQRRAATRIAGKHHRHPVCALPHRMSLGRTRPLSWPLPHGESVCIDARMMFGPRDQFVHVRFGRVEGAGDTDDARARSAAAREAVTLGDQPFPDRPGQGDQDEVDLGRPAKVHAGNRRQPVAHPLGHHVGVTRVPEPQIVGDVGLELDGDEGEAELPWLPQSNLRPNEPSPHVHLAVHPRRRP